jgi:hypothetical protein
MSRRPVTKMLQLRCRNSGAQSHFRPSEPDNGKMATGKKTGGRRRGTPNKITTELRQQLN